MANPNLFNTTILLGKTAVANVSTVSSNIVVNVAASNKLFKINSLYIANNNTLATANITSGILRGGLTSNIAREVSVPFKSTVVLISKESPLYLEEGDALRVQSSSNNFLQAICSYEEIS